MKRFLLSLTIAITVISCGTQPANYNSANLKSGTENSAKIIDLGEYPGGHVYKLIVDSSSYIMVNDQSGVALTKHK
jgi:hypothetical protein